MMDSIATRLLLGMIFYLGWPSSLQAQEDSALREEYFSKQVLPLLREHCFECHSHESGESNGKLMLDSLAAMTDGGTRGPAVLVGNPRRSLLLKAIEYDDAELQMPPDHRLSNEHVQVFRQWLEAGAQVPAAMRGQSSSSASSMGKASDESIIETHWAYQPPQRVSTLERSSAAGALDAILLRELASQGLSFSERADRPTLLRRLSYDLLGLPPEAHEAERYFADPRSDELATQAVVERMLASPHFGERWARYWMDVARYADNKGYVFQEDREYAEAYKYRDWLIDSFNRDLPYDQFVAQQLAADLLASEGDATDLPALGFLTLGRRFLNNKLDIVDDRLDVVSRGLMGMTLACARCHDHKYDPVSQADYYSLAGVFLNTDEPGGEPWPHRLADSAENRDSHILLRGSPGNRGAKVARRFVSFLAPEETPFATGSGRVELAGRIVSADNPLTARVLANRIWMHLTGASLVESPSDLGTRCPPPRQLALLDHLALELIDSGWSIKSLVRAIVLSDVYAQQSMRHPQGDSLDPTNELYWRMNRRRLDFESLRDTLLTRTNSLNTSLHGKSEAIDAQPFSGRRTVYTYIDRQNLPSVFRTFDLASPDSHSPGRAQTSVPQQGLFLLNSGFMAERANQLAASIRVIAKRDGQQTAVQQLFVGVLGRAPSTDEAAWLNEFVAEQSQSESLPVERWICGYGRYDPEAKRLRSFERLPKLIKGQWQGGRELPDKQLGWCILQDSGGHPGNDLEHAVVRRWIAPRTGHLRISGRLEHTADEGDGVRCSISLADASIGGWSVHKAVAQTDVDGLQVQAGQFVDFITDCLASPNNDSFLWSVTVAYTDGAGEQFHSVDELPGPVHEPLDAWALAVQALLASNELAFVD